MPCENCPDNSQQESPFVEGWKVWYANRRVYSSKENKWEDLPTDGVLGVLLFFRGNLKRTMTGSDYYFYAPGFEGKGIYAQSSVGESKVEIEKRYPGAVILRGKWTDDEAMHLLDKIMLDAKLD